MSKKKIFLTSSFIIIFLLFLLVCTNVNFRDIYSIGDNSIIYYDDINNINKFKTFGRFVNVELNNDNKMSSSSEESTSKVVFKLFGIIPIKEIEVNSINSKSVYIGGIPLGLSIKTDGLIIIGNNSSEIQKFIKEELQAGDVITHINNEKVSDIYDIDRIINSTTDQNVEIKILRGEKNKTIKVNKFLDEDTKKYKLGLWVKDDVSGVGTLTYVDKNNRFAALGHPVTESKNSTIIPITSGNIYDCNIIGLNKSEKGIPGEIKGLFLQGKDKKGDIDKNCEYGIFGDITQEEYIDRNKEIEVGGRLSVKPGKALLVSMVSGIKEEYEIEIIKVSYQPKSSTKSFIFRVTDKRLLEMTGGIIQGMSGSPILQNGKLIGAVTHVFVSDPTKGYGIYIDWMINQ